MTTVEETAAVAVPEDRTERASAAQDALRRFARPVAAVRSQPHAATYAGVLLATVGAVLLVVAWGRTAGTEQVSLQIPYVLSAGFTGLGLIVVGLTVVNLAAKARDTRERSRQLAELREILGEVRRGLEAQDQPRTPRRREGA